MPELVKEGFKYTNENGEEEIIKRAELNIEEYTYTKEQQEKKQQLMVKCIDMYPNIDKSIINILVDYYINHQEKLEEECLLDEDYRKMINV
tara:strand:- start:922 stop:1194 length:273 start_codon:yes stop_codon:yes gene_type:complete